MTNTIDGHDPLLAQQANGLESEELINQRKRGSVRNILDSYTGWFDVFSESIQNALDALQQKEKESEDGDYTPHLHLSIDIPDRQITVVDNGVGMDTRQFKLCFTPHTTFKRGERLRGKKGVGATFLAYGFSFIELQSKKDDVQNAAILEGGRQWVEEEFHSRPKLQAKSFDVDKLTNDTSGTYLRIKVGQHPKEKPTDLTWWQATTAKEWLDVLRIKSPLGGVYLKEDTADRFDPKVTVEIRAQDGATDSITVRKSEFYYPHDFDRLKKQDLTSIQEKLSEIGGDPSTKERRIPNEYNKLDLIWDAWKSSELIGDDTSLDLTISEEDERRIREHEVTVYGAYVAKRKVWDAINDDEIGVRKGERILRGGLQMASDYMPQGDLITIPLEKYVGLQHNSFVIVHFMRGNMDMGRKVFQPEFTKLAKEIASEVTKEFIDYRHLLKKRTSKTGISSKRELQEWKRKEADWAESNPLAVFDDGNIKLVSEPQSEQDVITLYHQLIGAGHIRGIEILATSEHQQYDGIYRLDYKSGHEFSEANPLGVREEWTGNKSGERVLEYKYELGGIVEDIQGEEKDPDDVGLVVCWVPGDRFEEEFELRPLLVGDAGEDRENFAATHAAYWRTRTERPVFEVTVLEDLCGYLKDPEGEEARQRSEYSW